MRRLWLGGAGGLALLSAGLHLSTTGCDDLDQVEFGNPNALDRKNLPGEGGVNALLCNGGDGGVAVGEGQCPSFATDIYPYLTPTGKWRCSDVACHGAAVSPNLTCADPEGCYEGLSALAVGTKPYILPDAATSDLSTVSMLCSLQGGCGSKMPKPPAAEPTESELCIVEAWLKCGSPR